MDPISTLLAIVIVMGLLKRAPGLAQDLFDAIRDGLDRQAYADQLRRLRNAGIPPARSGPLWRRMLTNAYREGLGSRLAAAGRAGGAFARRLDDAAGRAAERLRRRHGDPNPADPGPVRASATVNRPARLTPPPPTRPPTGGDLGGGGGPGGSPRPPSATPMPAPIRATATVTTAAPTPAPRAVPASSTPALLTATVGRTTPATTAVALPAAAPTSAALPAGAATAVLEGDAITNTTPPAVAATPARLAIEGAESSMAVEVTGVASGAMECQGIAAAVEMANQAYINALTIIRARIAAVQDATLSNVEMQGSGAVMSALVAAGEAAAQAQAAARTCGTEIGPMMAIAANEFLKRS